MSLIIPWFVEEEALGIVQYFIELLVLMLCTSYRGGTWLYTTLHCADHPEHDEPSLWNVHCLTQFLVTVGTLWRINNEANYRELLEIKSIHS